MNKQISIYKINTEELFKYFKIKDKDYTRLAKRIIRDINEDIKNKKSKFKPRVFQIQASNGEFEAENIEYFIYYRHYETEPDWKFFLNNMISDESKIHSAINKSNAFICFMICENQSLNDVTDVEDGKNIFAITGGSASSQLGKYIDQLFGIKILAKLVDDQNKAIKQSRARGIVGNVYALSQIYKDDQPLLKSETYGKVFNEITADLDWKDIEESLGIEIENRPKVHCVANNSFRLNKSISSDQLMILISKINELLSKPDLDLSFNKFRQIGNRTKDHQALRKKLNNELLIRFQKLLSKKNKEEFHFDLMHVDYEKYFFSTSYKLIYKDDEDTAFITDERPDLDSLCIFLRKNFKSIISTQKEFLKHNDDFKIVAYDNDGQVMTSDKFSNHFQGEMLFNEKRYFLIDRAWLELESDVIDSLNADLESMLSKYNFNSLSLRKWTVVDYHNEDQYNLSYCNEKNSLVFHKLFHEKIEIADVIKWDDDNVYLIHVKKGFDSSMRDLTSQIINSARLVSIEKAGNNLLFVDDLYNDLSNKKTSTDPYFSKVYKQTESITKKEFKELFISRNVVFCLAVKDTTSIQDLKNVKKYQSNIAKMSLYNLINTMNSIGSDLIIEMI